MAPSAQPWGSSESFHCPVPRSPARAGEGVFSPVSLQSYREFQTNGVCVEAWAAVLIWRGRKAVPSALAEVAFVLLKWASLICICCALVYELQSKIQNRLEITLLNIWLYVATPNSIFSAFTYRNNKYLQFKYLYFGIAKMLLLIRITYS